MIAMPMALREKENDADTILHNIALSTTVVNDINKVKGKQYRLDVDAIV